MENEPIFSNEIPMPPGKELRRKAQAAPCEAKPKRKYTRRTPEIPPPDGPQVEEMESKTALLSAMPEARIVSFGLEYIKALTALLELIGEPQRGKLVDFIIHHSKQDNNGKRG